MIRISKVLKNDWQIIAIIILDFIIGIYCYNLLSDKILMNWSSELDQSCYNIKIYIAFVNITFLLMYISIGNVMGRFKDNYFMAIKPPWTLSNKQVWKRTHRMAGSI